MKTVGILNYGTGNLSSLIKSIAAVGAVPRVVKYSNELKQLDALILPGVGHFGTAIRYLHEQRLIAQLRSLLRDGLPTLGICLGFQLLCKSSEEYPSLGGLHYFPFTVTRLQQVGSGNVKVPHIGWNSLSAISGCPRLLKGLKDDEILFYYSNCFGVITARSVLIGASYKHGCDYLALGESDNVFGVQFHPEKSGAQGKTILRNFMGVCDA